MLEHFFRPFLKTRSYDRSAHTFGSSHRFLEVPHKWVLNKWFVGIFYTYTVTLTLLPGGRGVLSGGPEGRSRWPKATSPPQELEVGARRAPYLLVFNIRPGFLVEKFLTNFLNFNLYWHIILTFNFKHFLADTLSVPPHLTVVAELNLRGGLKKKKLDKIKTLAESPLPPPPPRTLRHSLYDFHILHRPPPLNLD